jgi:hypothetical protein
MDNRYISNYRDKYPTTRTSFTPQQTQDAKSHTTNMNDPNVNYNKKLLDVNNYYILKYKSESHILKIIIFFCGLALIGCLFFLKGFIGETLYIIYLGFIITIGLFYVIYNIYDLKYRDNQRFDEYDYGYMQKPGTDLPKINKTPKKEEETNIKDNKKNKCL